MTVQELVRKKERAPVAFTAGLRITGMASAPNAAGPLPAPSAAGLDSTQAIVKEESEDEEDSEDEEERRRNRKYDYIFKLESMVKELGGNLPTRPWDF